MIHHGLLNRNQANYLLLNCAKRLCDVEIQRQVYYPLPRAIRLLKDPSNKFIAWLIGSGIVITMCFVKMETIPYSKRKHIVLSSKAIERMLGGREFNKMKAELDILSEKHPESIRVRSIAKDIIESLHKGMNKDDTSKALSNESISGRRWTKWVQRGRKKDATGHLEGLNLEIVVVNEFDVNACCLPGGKIMVYGGILWKFKSDAEIATIIGHEIAHVVARHAMEGLAKLLLFIIILMSLMPFIDLKLLLDIATLPLSRRNEMEADYIGTMLMASAGYDPRVAPAVFKKLGEITGEDYSWRYYFSTHPSSKKRAQALEQPKVMEKALVIYNDFKAERKAQLLAQAEVMYESAHG